MNRRLVLITAILSFGLMGSSCEFAVSSGRPIRDDATREGETGDRSDSTLVVDASAGGSSSRTATMEEGSAGIAAALQASVLTLPAAEPMRASRTSDADLGMWVAEAPGEPRPAPSAMQSAVPEPGAFLLFAAGSAILLGRSRALAGRSRCRRDACGFGEVDASRPRQEARRDPHARPVADPRRGRRPR